MLSLLNPLDETLTHETLDPLGTCRSATTALRVRDQAMELADGYVRCRHARGQPSFVRALKASTF